MSAMNSTRKYSPGSKAKSSSMPGTRTRNSRSRAHAQSPAKSSTSQAAQSHPTLNPPSMTPSTTSHVQDQAPFESTSTQHLTHARPSQQGPHQVPEDVPIPDTGLLTGAQDVLGTASTMMSSAGLLAAVKERPACCRCGSDGTSCDHDNSPIPPSPDPAAAGNAPHSTPPTEPIPTEPVNPDSDVPPPSDCAPSVPFSGGGTDTPPPICAPGSDVAPPPQTSEGPAPCNTPIPQDPPCAAPVPCAPSSGGNGNSSCTGSPVDSPPPSNPLPVAAPDPCSSESQSAAPSPSLPHAESPIEPTPAQCSDDAPACDKPLSTSESYDLPSPASNPCSPPTPNSCDDNPDVTQPNTTSNPSSGDSHPMATSSDPSDSQATTSVPNGRADESPDTQPVPADPSTGAPPCDVPSEPNDVEPPAHDTTQSPNSFLDNFTSPQPASEDPVATLPACDLQPAVGNAGDDPNLPQELAGERVMSAPSETPAVFQPSTIDIPTAPPNTYDAPASQESQVVCAPQTSAELDGGDSIQLDGPARDDSTLAATEPEPSAFGSLEPPSDSTEDPLPTTTPTNTSQNGLAPSDTFPEDVSQFIAQEGIATKVVGVVGPASGSQDDPRFPLPSQSLDYTQGDIGTSESPTTNDDITNHDATVSDVIQLSTTADILQFSIGDMGDDLISKSKMVVSALEGLTKSFPFVSPVLSVLKVGLKLETDRRENDAKVIKLKMTVLQTLTVITLIREVADPDAPGANGISATQLLQNRWPGIMRTLEECCKLCAEYEKASSLSKLFTSFIWKGKFGTFEKQLKDHKAGVHEDLHIVSTQATLQMKAHIEAVTRSPGVRRGHARGPA